MVTFTTWTQELFSERPMLQEKETLWEIPIPRLR